MSLFLAMAARAHRGGSTTNTWNPADKNSGLTLSSGNLVVSYSGTNGNLRGVRGTKGCSSGVHSFTATIDAGTYQVAGIATQATADISSSTYFPGVDCYGYGYEQSAGNKYNCGGGSAYAASYTTGDVIKVEADLDAGTVTFYKNGTSLGTAFSGINPGVYYPCVAIPNNGGQITADFTNW